MVTKWLYPEVAKHYATTWSCVEHGIRLAADMAWETNRELLEKLSRHAFEKKPTASKFLAILAAHFFTDPAA